MMLSIQLLTMMLTARDRLVEAASHARDDERGELTGNAIRTLHLCLF
jgi:hypothetical protein